MTGRDLRAEIVAALTAKPMTVDGLAMLLRVRRSDVTDVLATDGFAKAPTPPGASRRASHWTVSAAARNGSRRVPSGCDRVLALLADHSWHSYHELYALNVIAHSRVAELRKRGYVIECDKSGDDFKYRLGALGEVTSGHPGAATTGTDVASSSALDESVSCDRGGLPVGADSSSAQGAAVTEPPHVFSPAGSDGGAAVSCVPGQLSIDEAA